MMETATRKEAIEIFLLQDDYASLNREIGEAKTFNNQEAETFFEKELKPAVNEGDYNPEEVFDSLSDESKMLLKQWNSYVETQAFLMTLLGGEHKADLSPDGKCYTQCSEEDRAACPLFQEALMEQQANTAGSSAMN